MILFDANGNQIEISTDAVGIPNTQEWHWNIVNPDETEEGSLNTSGAEIAGSTAFTYRRTGFIPVTAGEELHFLWQTVYGYDANKKFVGEVKNTGGVAVITDGVAYIRATRYSSDGTTPIFYIYRRGYGNNSLKYSDSYNYSHGFPVFTDEDSKNGFKAHLGIHPWADKKFCFIGDSFTAPGTWCTIMCDNLRSINVKNTAISGGAFADYDGVPLTAYEQAQSLVNGGYEADVILITLGTNDSGHEDLLGEIVQSNSISDFDLGTYTGGMQACLNYLQNNFPNAIIYVGWTPMGGLVNGSKEAFLARMREVCLMYGVEYIETRTCGVTRFSDVYAECYEKGVNGGHPTVEGQQKIGAYMTRLIQSKM